MAVPTEDDVDARLDRLEIGFNAAGVDAFGVSRAHLAVGFRWLGWLYRRYFRVRVHGIDNVPARGRAMLVCNHAGGYAVDAAMLIAACFFDKEPPRLAHGMADRFIGRLPFASIWANRTGQITGLPEHARRLLEDERLVMVFPEGTRGTAKVFSERHSLVRFGTGFLRLALAARAPVVPVAFVGGGEAVPTIANLRTLGRLLGVPYVPVTPYLLPLPLPVGCELVFGEPLVFEGDGSEADATVERYVEEVRSAIGELIQIGKRKRRER
ncbi:MAG TPA: lysophospholipid acyltransferase family protein [Polyangiaceae bacterium]|nr:lysophospholipid acyltransferase family protein [Polyangiaceae bacterium]